ncbi:MAG: class II aldolase/adducin family protein [Chloroflexi bacterium]|nr:class II aldolase/adducin family protein [Chloroflexota bacterium]
MNPEELLDLKREVSRISIKAYERGLVFGTGGNISARIPGTGLALITATGVSLGDTTVENLSVIDIETGEPTPDSPAKPSKERYFHAAVYRIRPDINALCHLHPPYATALSVDYGEMPLVTITAEVNLVKVPCAPCAVSGSQDLRKYVEDTVAATPGVKAILMCRHGLLSLGQTLVQAYNLADLTEDSARAAFLVEMLRKK